MSPATRPIPVVFNGKFYSGGMNGVHRVADRLLHEVDGLLGQLPVAKRPQVSIIIPRAATWRPSLSTIRIQEHEGKCGQLWEQTGLPWQTRNALLVNLCNLAPILHRQKMLLIHDAQFLFPDSSYPWRQRVGYKLLVPWMARTSQQVLTVSQYSRQMLDLLGVSARERTAVLYNGVDHVGTVEPSRHKLDELQLVAGKYVVLFASTKAYKNNKVIFEAFEDARLADVRLVLVGANGKTFDGSGLSPPGNTVFAGRVNDAELHELYASALCVVFPSRTEGFGLPPAEAMACGCPTVVSPAGAIPEVCQDAAAYANVDSPGEWVEAICAYAENPGYRASKQASGKALMTRFTWSLAGLTLFEQILRTSGHRADAGTTAA